MHVCTYWISFLHVCNVCTYYISWLHVCVLCTSFYSLCTSPHVNVQVLIPDEQNIQNEVPSRLLPRSYMSKSLSLATLYTLVIQIGAFFSQLLISSSYFQNPMNLHFPYQFGVAHATILSNAHFHEPFYLKLSQIFFHCNCVLCIWIMFFIETLRCGCRYVRLYVCMVSLKKTLVSRCACDIY